MNKHHILSLVVPALLVVESAQAAEIYNKSGNKLDLYGRAVANRSFSDYSSNDGDVSYARLGFKGETQINEAVTGYGQWEYNFNLNNSEGSDAKTGDRTRLGFAGLSLAGYGSIDYGRNLSVVYDALSWTDMLPAFGGSFGYGDTMTALATGRATYRNSNFFGLVEGWDFALQYQTKNDRDDVTKANGEGWGISSSYTSPDGIGIVAAYQEQNRTNKQNLAAYGKGKKASIWATGVKYDANQVYLAAMYGEGQNATPISGTDAANKPLKGFVNKTQGFELVAQYQFEAGLRPSLAYIQTRGKDIEGIGDVDINKYVEVGASYSFNKNMSTYLDYQINLLKDDNKLNLPTDNIFAAGLVYQF